MLFLGHPLANFIVFVLAFIINRVFYMRRQLLLSAVLAIAVLSVRLSHRWISRKQCKLG